MTEFDITFIGHMAVDELKDYGAPPRTAPGSAVLFGASAAARIGYRVQIVTRMSSKDDALLVPLRDIGVSCTIIPAPKTTRMEIIHPTPNVDERVMRQPDSAGPFSIDEIPCLDSACIHLAGITDREFTVPFITALRRKANCLLSADMQCFVRQVDPRSKVVTFKDVADKDKLFPLFDKVKLDSVEATLLTGTDRLKDAAKRIEDWGCPEVIITRADGVLARVRGKSMFEPFTNRSQTGRTGRGDTTFAAYLAWRIEHDPAEALAFAAALVSIKMEKPGPFSGTREDVLARMNR